MGKIIGIDLGTTNSCMAVLEGDQPTIVTNGDGDRTTPSVVAWKGGERIVGKTALRQRVTNVDNTIYSVKRYIGRNFSELTDIDKEGIAYRLEGDAKGRPVVDVDVRGDGGTEQLLAEQVSAAVLSKLREDASRFLGEEVDEAVITVPAYFNDAQRHATEDAGRIAGLKVRRIINEPTAAALAYGYGKGVDESRRIMVFDLGGGTLDISILNVAKDFIEVLSTAGDNHLGGDLWDSVFCSAIERRFLQDTGGECDLAADPQTHARVLEAARNAKHDLSNSETVNINLPFIGMGKDGVYNLDYDYSRDEFEAITGELLDRCRGPIDAAMSGVLDSPGLEFSDIDAVLLVGGSTRMPSVRRLVREVTGKEPEMSVNPDEVVAMGAAVQGGVMSGDCQGIVLADVTPMSLGVEANDGRTVTMIERNTSIPVSETKLYTTAADDQTSVEINVVQGEAEMASGNKSIGRFSLEGIPAAPRGVPQIEVTFDIDVNGIVQVTARDRATGKSQHITITGSTRLDDGEVAALAAAERAVALPA